MVALRMNEQPVKTLPIDNRRRNRLLRGHGSVRDTVTLAADQHPDVVLLNLELSSMDGRHLARQLRLDSPQRDYFIIAFADWADGGRRRQCSEAGIDLLLVKPVDPSVLECCWGWNVCANLQRVVEAGNRKNLLTRIGVHHVDRNA